jgi:hypothetical protein
MLMTSQVTGVAAAARTPSPSAAAAYAAALETIAAAEPDVAAAITGELARRVEEPALRAAGVRHVNELPDADWRRLRTELHSQRSWEWRLTRAGT